LGLLGLALLILVFIGVIAYRSTTQAFNRMAEKPQQAEEALRTG
jgi:hypothetical protein